MCEVCKDSHTVSQCSQFKQLSDDEKYKIWRSNKLCINCLSNKHMIKDCQSHGFKICGKKTFQDSIVMEVKVCHSSNRIYKLHMSVNGLMEKNKNDGDD